MRERLLVCPQCGCDLKGPRKRTPDAAAVVTWLGDRGRGEVVSIDDVARHALGIEDGRILDRQRQMINRFLRKGGFQPVQISQSGTRGWRWVRQ